jgi:hypothetical protein
MENRKIHPLKMGKQPFFWRQAVSDSPNRGWSLRNILLFPLIKYKYRFKKHESFLCDALIIGSNPVLTILLLRKLAQQAYTQKTPLKIGILRGCDADYWAYHEFKKADFLDELSKHFNYDISDGKDLIAKIVKSTNWSYLEPVLMNLEDLSVEYIKKDNYVNGFVGHIVATKNDTLSFSKYLPNVNAQENRLKDKLWINFSQLLSDFVPSYKELDWKEPIHNTPDKLEKSHILLTKKVFLSSLPSGWMDIQTDVKEKYTFFKHDFISQSVGSAVKIANNFHILEVQALEDIKDVDKLSLA